MSDWFTEHSDDPLEGPPETWPAWTDHLAVSLGRPLTPEELIPDPTPEDLEDAYCASRYQDMLEGIARFTDEDLEAAGLPVG